MGATRALVLNAFIGVTCGTLLRRDAPVGLLGEMNQAEQMMKSQLKGNPKMLDEELHLLHTAEDIAHRNKDILAKAPAAHATTQLLQSETSSAQRMTKDGQMLGTARAQVERLLAGHPAALRKEEVALNIATEAAQHLAHPRKSAFVQGKTESLATVETGLAELEQKRMSSMAAAVEEHRNFAVAESKLAKAESQGLAAFATVKDAIASAFAGKDSKGVKVAMEVGEMVDAAKSKQQEVARGSAAEAALAKSEADREAAALTQMSAEGKTQRVEREYSSGMKKLAADGQAMLGEFAGVKGAVARAFAGQDSKGVEKAMEVGALLDEARREQQQVTEKDLGEGESAKDLFAKFHVQPRHSSLAQQHETAQVTSGRQSESAQSRKLRRMVSEHHIMDEANHVEDAVKKALEADRRAGAATVEHDVVDEIEEVKQMVRGST